MKLDELGEVPEMRPGESIEDYKARIAEHVGLVMKAAVAEKDCPDWIRAFYALRQAAERAAER